MQDIFLEISVIGLFDYIEKQSDCFGEKIALRQKDNEVKTHQEVQDDIEQCQYGMFAVLSQGFDTILIFIVSFLLNIIFQTNTTFPLIICIITFVLLRINGSGAHERTFKKCTITTVTTMTLMSLSAILLQNYSLLLFIIGYFVAVLIIPITPIENEVAKSRGKEKNLQFRKRYTYILLGFYIINIILLWSIYILNIDITYIFQQEINLKLISSSISVSMIFMWFGLTKVYSSLFKKFFSSIGIK